MENISKELVGASSVPIILSLLEQGDSYGYEIINKVNTISDGKIQWKEGSIYPVLKKLEETGMIESYWNMESNRRPRKYYKIKRSGKMLLQKEIKDWTIIQDIFKVLWKNQINSI